MHTATATVSSMPLTSTAALVQTAPSATSGSHRTMLRIEGAVMLVAGVAAWWLLGGSWGWFAALFLVPDVSLGGYVVGPKVGAVVYNLGHSLVLPFIVAGLGLWLSAPTAFLAAALWVAHIGFDRLAGYGLKASSSFFDTHLGRIGKQA